MTTPEHRITGARAIGSVPAFGMLTWILAATFGLGLLLDLPIRRFQYFIPLGQTYLAPLFGFLALLSVWLVVEVRARLHHTTLSTALRMIFVGITIAVTLLLATAVQMSLRSHVRVPELAVHDGVVQTEQALTFLQHGTNPYAADYRATPFGTLIDEFSKGTLPNPAWQHYVYPPGYLVTSFPLFASVQALGGTYDQRLMHILWLVAALGALWYGLSSRLRPISWLLFSLNPLFIWYFITGYNDIAVIACLLWVAAFWRRGYIARSFFALGLAITMKQFAFLFLPVACIALLYWHRASWRRAMFACVIPVAVIYGAFLVWNAPALIDDLVRFPSSGGIGSYPVSGFGFSSLLLSMGVIASARDSYPFWIFQIAVLVPALWMAQRMLRTNGSAWIVFFGGLAASFAFFFFARYFNDSHLVFLLTAALVAGLFAWDDELSYA